MTSENKILFSCIVRVKKTEGQLKLTEQHIEWSPDASQLDQPKIGKKNKNKVQSSFNLAWSTIKDQQVSSASSPRAMIRLNLVNNTNLILDFLHANGLSEAFKVRDQAKNIIISHTNKVKKAISHRAALCNEAELKQRAALLASNPPLKRQHTQMVDGEIISEEDFWDQRSSLLVVESVKRQKSGKTSRLLTDFSESGDKGGVVKYNLNAEIIHQIFVQHPVVFRAYQANVPDKLSETEFWGLFFRSKHFHRDRTKDGHEDLFTQYQKAEEDQKQMSVVEVQKQVDPLIDLTISVEDKISHQIETPSKSDKEDISQKFNRHAAYVLDTYHGSGSHTLISPASSSSRARTIHDSIDQAVLMEDLESKKAATFIPLTLENEKLYFQNLETKKQTLHQHQSIEAEHHFIASLPQILQDVRLENAFPSPQLAQNALNDIQNLIAQGDEEDGGNAFQVSQSITLDSIPQEFKTIMYDNFHSVCELLRHFWAFSTKKPRTPMLDDKVERIIAKMDEKLTELRDLRANLPHDQKNRLAPLLKPFNDQLHAAFVARDQQKQEESNES